MNICRSDTYTAIPNRKVDTLSPRQERVRQTVRDATIQRLFTLSISFPSQPGQGIDEVRSNTRSIA